MKKLQLLLTVLLSFISYSCLHAQATDATIRMNKVDRPGITATYPYTEGIVQNALRARLEKAGVGKPKSKKGFDSYLGVNWPEIATGQVDIYTNVEGKKNESTVSLLVSKGYDNYVSPASDSAMNMKLKAFMNSLLVDVQAGQLQSEIGGQQEILQKAEKDLKNSQDDLSKLQREKEKIEKQIADANDAISKNNASVEAQKAKLDSLKALVK